MAAKKTGGARSRAQGSAASAEVVRQPGARNRKSTARRRARQAAHQAGAPLGHAGEMVRGRMGARGLLAEARDMAQSVGETTMNTARGFASGVGGAARGVARGTQATAVQVAGKVRDNRWPALLIGAGATWLVVDAIRGRGEEEGPRERRSGGETRRRSSSRQQRGMASDAVSSLAGAGRRVGRFVRDNPVLAGATTIGLGMAVGMALPASRAEQAVLGDAREKMLRQAKDAARGTMRNVRDVAESVGRLTGRE